MSIELTAVEPFWQKLDLKPQGYVNSIAINSRGTIYASSNSDIFYRSTDNGSTWLAINDTIMNSIINTITVDIEDNIYLGTEKGIYKSYDNGKSFIRIAPLTVDESIYSLCFLPNGMGFAGTWNGLYRVSGTEGIWERVKNLSVDQHIYLDYYHNELGTYIYSGTYSDGVYRSGNGGNTWTRLRHATALDWLDVHAMDIDKKAGLIIASTDEGMKKISWAVRKISNDSNWQDINEGLEGIRIRSILADNGYIFAGSWNKGCFFSSDSGFQWLPFNYGLESNKV